MCAACSFHQIPIYKTSPGVNNQSHPWSRSDRSITLASGRLTSGQESPTRLSCRARSTVLSSFGLTESAKCSLGVRIIVEAPLKPSGAQILKLQASATLSESSGQMTPVGNRRRHASSFLSDLSSIVQPVDAGSDETKALCLILTRETEVTGQCLAVPTDEVYFPDRLSGS
jgi:hypothetical protein